MCWCLESVAGILFSLIFERQNLRKKTHTKLFSCACVYIIVVMGFIIKPTDTENTRPCEAGGLFVRPSGETTKRPLTAFAAATGAVGRGTFIPSL